MILKTRGIVLKSFKYGESSQIVTIYTEAAGLQKYIVSGLRQKKPQVSPALLQPLSVVELVGYHKEGKDLHRVKEMRAAFYYHCLPFDLPRSSIGLFLTELIQKTIRISEPHPHLFDFLLEALTLLDQTPYQVNNFHLCFMLHFTRYLGIQPGDNFAVNYPLFDLREGLYLSPGAEGIYTLPEGDSLHWWHLSRTALEDSHLLTITGQERRALLQHLLNYFKIHLESMPELHSHEILEQVLRG